MKIATMSRSPLAAKQVPLHLVQLKNVPILQQLQWEEALLRADQRNWCLINMGSPPAIVMGISGTPENFINLEMVGKASVQIIKRFSGGGTVFVDSNTFFVSWICNSADAALACCPTQIHAWSIQFYQKALPAVPMHLKENDYVIGERKCGGNAQYLRRGRWLHHSTLLWDYDPQSMHYLTMPKKTPTYRQGRSHQDFLCRLADFLPNVESLQQSLLSSLAENFRILEMGIKDLMEAASKEHRKATHHLEIKKTAEGSQG